MLNINKLCLSVSHCYVQKGERRERERERERERDQNAFVKLSPNIEYEIIFDI